MTDQTATTEDQLIKINAERAKYGLAPVTSLHNKPATPTLTRRQLERRHDNLFNEGGEGYNPYR